MITQWQSGETIVGCLRVEGARVDPALAQLRLSTLLNRAVTHPTTLPPSALIFIRKLGDPLPRLLRIQQHDNRPPAAWQQALNEKLEGLAKNAARPALGAVPANAQAVVFLDWSELLASLAIDWCEGQIAARWWWQTLLRKATASQIVRELWRSAPEYVPAALDQLTRAGKTAQFVKTFSDSEAQGLLVSVARRFRLDDLVRVLDEIRFERQPNLTLPQSSDFQSAVPSKFEAIRAAPWKDWLRGSETGFLRPEQHTFLGVALMLQRAPSRVRTTSFTRDVENWLREVIAAQPMSSDRSDALESPDRNYPQTRSTPQVHADHVAETSSVAVNSTTTSPKEISRDFTHIALEDTDSNPADATATAVRSHDLELVDSSQEEPSLSREPSVSSHRQPSASPEHQSSTTSLEEYGWTAGKISFVSTEPPTTVTSDQLSLIEFQTETEFGGFFYLINLGTYLGYYGDFTTPLDPGIDLNIWDFVALLGRELAGEQVDTDPVWTLLQRLADRDEGEDPGSPQVKAWLDEQMPFIRTRLRSALGLIQTEDPGPIVCRQHSRVTLTPTHIDVFFALADLPIEIRVAGLDRDPGWVPAAGRFINFYFE